MEPKMSLVIPAHNEAMRLGRTLEDYLGYFSKMGNGDFELIVVCNGCQDGTEEIARDFSSRFPQIRTLAIANKMGKGGAIKEGFKAARGEAIAFADADGAVGPEDIWRLARAVQRGADGAIGSRRVPGARILTRQPLRRRLASRGFNLVVRLLFGIPFRDTQCGAKAFRRHVIHHIMDDLQAPGFTFDVNVLWQASQKGYGIEELPVTWEHKPGSTFALSRHVPRMAWELVRLRIHRSSRNGAARRG